jgi:hypothetical protein
MVAALLQRVRDECFPAIERFSVPFYGLQDGQVKHDRTGVLYRIAQDHFILTAAHDLRAIIKHAIPLFIPPIVADAGPIALRGAIFHTTEEDGRDVAAIKLPSAIAEQLRPGREFLSHDKIARTDDGKGLYVVFGYPMAWTVADPSGAMSSHPLIYLARTYTGEMLPETYFDPKVHIALQFEEDAIEVTTGEPVQLPSMRGISGCGIWRVSDWNAESLAHCSEKNLRLVGLQHRRISSARRNYVQGTQIQYAIGRIADAYPELARPMNLIVPG